jgi:PKD repeat protein
MKTKTVFTLLLTTSIFIYSCSKKDNGGGITPSASFTLSEVAGNSHAPSTVNFSNTSTYGNTYSWNFGDGSSSSADAPSHKYTTAGNYSITLIASAGGKTSTTTRSITILPAYTKVKVSAISISASSTTETSPFTGFFRILDINGAQLWQSENFSITPSTLPGTATFTSPYTCTSISSAYTIEFRKTGIITSTLQASTPFLPYLYNVGTSSLNSYPTSISGLLQGLGATLQWQ